MGKPPILRHVRAHGFKDEADVVSVWTLVLKLVKEFKDVASSWMLDGLGLDVS